MQDTISHSRARDCLCRRRAIGSRDAPPAPAPPPRRAHLAARARRTRRRARLDAGSTARRAEPGGDGGAAHPIRRRHYQWHRLSSRRKGATPGAGDRAWLAGQREEPRSRPGGAARRVGGGDVQLSRLVGQPGRLHLPPCARGHPRRARLSPPARDGGEAARRRRADRPCRPQHGRLGDRACRRDRSGAEGRRADLRRRPRRSRADPEARTGADGGREHGDAGAPPPPGSPARRSRTATPSPSPRCPRDWRACRCWC